jgi:hypothetical protein
VAGLPSAVSSEGMEVSVSYLFVPLITLGANVDPQAAKPAVPLTYLEQKRKDAQLQYKEEQAYIQSHKADFERLLEEDRQAMAKEMSGTLWGALDALTGAPKKEEGKKVAADGTSGVAPPQGKPGS